MSQIELPALPWAHDALAPAISQATIETHWGKHHRTYVTKTNAAIEGTDLAGKSLEDVIRAAAAAPEKRGLFNNSAQIWNHSRYWESLSPDGGQPSDALAAKIESDLGGMAKLKADMVAKGVGHFASGWVWLTHKGGTLHLIDTHDADTALIHGHDCLLVLDVWEHAYYIDYKNERDRHLNTLVNECLNWRGASDRFAAAVG